MLDMNLSVDQFSNVIGEIYDCTLDPNHWPNAIEAICTATHCIAGSINVVDLDTQRTRLRQSWNHHPDWLARMPKYQTEIASIWNHIPDRFKNHDSEPFVGLRNSPIKVILSTVTSRFYREWARPQGIIDTIQLAVLRQGDRFGTIGLSRHKSAGRINDLEIGIMKLLAPHIRRAVVISDVLDMQAIEIDTLNASLDLFRVGIVLVDEGSRIVHANQAAERMLMAGTPIQICQGALRTSGTESSAALKTAIAATGTEEAMTGKMAICIPVLQADREPALIHILPLLPSALRTRISSRATTALFITSTNNSGLSTAALTTLYNLTAAETRILELLLSGKTTAQIAAGLGIAVSTVRTHVLRILGKTGTSRKSELIRLAAQFSAPV